MTTVRARLANDPAMPRVGDTIAERYRVDALIGEGGFAAVFRATDTRTGQTVAMKVLDPFMSRRPELAARFEREVAVVSRLKHHNTIKVFDTGRTDGNCLYLVMELLDGIPLDELLADAGPLSERRVHRIAVQVLKSLAEAHAQGVVHRDLKPANLFHVRMVGEDDYVKVLDFGIAKASGEDGEASLTQTGEVMCSPPYVAPERIAGRAGPESDLYSLGIVMLELLTGRPPYLGETPMAVMIQHASSDEVPVPDALREGALGEVLRRALAKPLEERYASALEMLDDLQRVTEGLRSEPLTASMVGRMTLSPPVVSTGAASTLYASSMNTGAVTRSLDATASDESTARSRGPVPMPLLVGVGAGFAVALLVLLAYVAPMLRDVAAASPDTEAGRGDLTSATDAPENIAPGFAPSNTQGEPTDEPVAAADRLDGEGIARAAGDAAQRAVRGAHELRTVARGMAIARTADAEAAEATAAADADADRVRRGAVAGDDSRRGARSRDGEPAQPVAVGAPSTPAGDGEATPRQPANAPAVEAAIEVPRSQTGSVPAQEPPSEGGRRIRPVAPR